MPDGEILTGFLPLCRACGLAPVMMINDEVYGGLAVDDNALILAKYE